MAGCEARKKISVTAYPKQLENLTFVKISEIIKRNLRPKKKLVIVGRTKFLLIKQKQAESIMQYLHRLREASRFCEFEKLGTRDFTIEDELVQLKLIEDIADTFHKYKILELITIE